MAAGGFALAHMMLILAGIALQRSPLFGEGTEGIQRGCVEGDMAQTMAGGMIEVLGRSATGLRPRCGCGKSREEAVMAAESPRATAALRWLRCPTLPHRWGRPSSL
jgi:hypothetical protein